MAVVAKRAGKVRVGITLSDLELCAVDLDRRSTASAGWRTPLEPPSGDGATWPSLVLAMQELARAFQASEGSELAIALLPPLVEVRRLELPPLNDEELQRLLSRSAGKYFVNARGPQLVGTLRAARRARGTPSSVVAAAAPSRLLALIHAAAANAGWTTETIGPAEGAWTAAALSLWPALARRDAYLLVSHASRTDLLQFEQGKLANVRRFRAGAADEELIAQTIAPLSGSARASVSVAAVGVGASRTELAQSLAGRGITVTIPTSEWAATAAAPELLAAAFADATKGPQLRSGDARAATQANERRITTIVVAAAIVLLMLSGGIQLLGIRRKLSVVQAERAALAPAIKATLVGRTSVETAYQRLTELTKADRTAPRWSAVLTALSEHLSEEAYFTAFRGRDDSLSVDGLALRATQVFDDLEQTPGLTGVRAVAPVRRDAEDKGEPMEHFSLAARIGAPSSATPPRAGSGRGAP